MSTLAMLEAREELEGEREGIGESVNATSGRMGAGDSND